MENSQIIDFYLGERPDNRRRMINNIWEWDDEPTLRTLYSYCSSVLLRLRGCL
jgi:hypothetical protein